MRSKLLPTKKNCKELKKVLEKNSVTAIIQGSDTMQQSVFTQREPALEYREWAEGNHSPSQEIVGETHGQNVMPDAD